jgi:hypothetical protein
MTAFRRLNFSRLRQAPKTGPERSMNSNTAMVSGSGVLASSIVLAAQMRTFTYPHAANGRHRR